MKKLLVRMARQSPALIVAMLALFVALTGTAVATTSALIRKHPDQEQLDHGSRREEQVADAEGLSRLRPRSARPSGLDRRGRRSGSEGRQGRQGRQRPGPDVCDHTAGTADLDRYLECRAGRHVTRYVACANLAAKIPAANVHYVTGLSATNCPGHGQAAPGHLCIYQYFTSDLTFIQTNTADRDEASFGQALAKRASCCT